ncbi:MAG: hypothetical protein RLZZ293_496 [Pseudomonadota bacterium]|jgi:hypothetical protein
MMKKLALLAVLGAISSSVFATNGRIMKMFHYTDDSKTVDAYVVALVLGKTVSGYDIKGITLNGSDSQGEACKMNFVGWPTFSDIGIDDEGNGLDFSVNSINASGKIKFAMNDKPSGVGFIKFNSDTVNVNDCVYKFDGNRVDLNLVSEVDFPS